MGHKTNGDWSDITSAGRNEIVFEGRHKAYGAYYVRQRYNAALLLGLLSSLSVVVLCAGVPLMVNLFSKHTVVADKGTHVKVLLRRYDFPPTPNKPKPKINTAPINRPKPKPKPVATKQNTPPQVVKQNPTTDVPTNKQMQTAQSGTQTTKGIQSQTPVLPKEDEHTGPIGTTLMKPIHIAEVMPQFNGDLEKYIKNHTRYPDQLLDLRVSGTVWASFIVEPDGSVSNVQLLHGVSGGALLDSEALRVLRTMPDWKPGMQGGHPVRVQFNMPIHFDVE